MLRRHGLHGGFGHSERAQRCAGIKLLYFLEFFSLSSSLFSIYSTFFNSSGNADLGGHDERAVDGRHASDVE